MIRQGKWYESAWAHTLLLVCAVAALYGQFLWNPLVFDDRDFFLLDFSGKAPVSTYQFSWLKLRALPYETLALTWEWLGRDLIYFRIGNLILHAATVIALYFLLAKLFSTVYGKGQGSALSPRAAAFFAALLFALHPVAVYAAGYLVQRSTVMATLFALLALLAYVHGSLRASRFWLWACVPLYYLSVLSKEHAIMLPAALLALTVLLHDDWPTKIRQRWGVFAFLAGIAAWVLLTKANLIGAVYEPKASEILQQVKLDHIYLLSVLTQTFLFFKYALLWLFPNPAWMSVDMREPFAASLLSPYWVAAIAYLAWGAVAAWLLLKRGRAGLLGFALLFPWLMFWTEFAAVRIQEPFVLYRSYLWAVGAFCLLPLLFERCNGRLAIFILSAVVLAMFPVSMERLVTFSNSILLWDDAKKLVVDRSGLLGTSRIYYNLGTAYLKMDFVNPALSNLEKAVSLQEDSGEAHANYAYALAKAKRWEESAAEYNQAIGIFIKKGLPPQWKYFYGRAEAYEKMGNVQAAEADYRVSCVLVGKGCTKLPHADQLPKK